MQSDAFYSQILNISIAGKSQQVVVRDLHRSPDSGKVLHVDFLRVRADQEINVNIPLRFVNEESCVGVKVGGGLITHNLNEVVDATIALIDSPKLSVKELLKIIPAPDFPTKAEIISTPEELLEMYQTGRGAVTVSYTHLTLPTTLQV